MNLLLITELFQYPKGKIAKRRNKYQVNCFIT